MDIVLNSSQTMARMMDMVIMAIPNVEECNHVGVQMRHFFKSCHLSILIFLL